MIDLYGRNPDENARFSYPYPLVDGALRGMEGAVAIRVPAEVYGRDEPSVGTVVAIDPRSPLAESRRTLGDVEVDQPSLAKYALDSFRQDPSTKQFKRGEASRSARSAIDRASAWYKGQNGTAQVAMVVVAGLVIWNLVKKLG